MKKTTNKWLSGLLTAALAASPLSPVLAAEGGNSAGASAPFRDTQGHWAQNSIDKWAASGILNGYADGTFHPDQEITRAEFVKVLNQLFGFYAKSGEAFEDVEASSWYAEELALARQAGYYEGFPGNKAGAGQVITRQDAVTLLARIFSLQANEGASAPGKFTDASQINAYAAAAVNALSPFLSGYEDGTFRPDGGITRAELVTVLQNLVVGFYTEPGSFEGGTPAGNVVVNEAGVVLKNATIQGNLYLTAGIGSGEVTLDGVKVTGRTFIAGGGTNSVILKDSLLGEVNVNRREGEVRVLASGSTKVDHVTVDSRAKLELEKGAKITTADINQPAALVVGEGAEIAVLNVGRPAAGTAITGTGSIAKAQIQGTGVTLNGKAVAEGTVQITKGEASPAGGKQPSGSGSSSGSSSSGGSSGGGSSDGGTTPQPRVENLADHLATAETRSLFAYLDDIRGKEILFGHQHATTEGFSITAKDGTQSEVQNAVGDLPGMFGWDTLSLEGFEQPGVNGASQQENRDKLIAVMKSAYREGGVLALSSHMPNFVTGKDFYDTKGNVLTHILPGGDKHAEFNQFLDMIADFALNLKDDNGKHIPVIFRPFHEQNGGWFWWGAPYRTKDQYIEIYRYTVEYLRDQKGVHNFLYAFSPGSPFNNTDATFLETYPGDDYVDILGFDTYYDGNTEGWFDAAVADAKLISKLADAKGKVAAFTEFGYSNVKPTGTRDLKFFTKLAQALKSDPDAKRMAYMLTWANFSTNSIFVPYKNAPNGLGDHELLPDFIDYYKDSYTSFSDEVRAAGAYSKQVTAAPEQPFMHIASPTANQTVPTSSASTIRAHAVNQNVDKMTYLIGSDPAEHSMALDAGGFYYTADWTPGAALDEAGTTLTVKSYAKDGKVLSQTIPVFVSDVSGITDPLVVDSFDTYKGSNELLDTAYSPAGDLNTISLDEEHKIGGKYGLKFAYNVNGQGYSGEVKNMNNVDWSEANKLKLWLEPDGSGNKLVLQVNASGISFEAYPSLTGTEAGVIEIPFSQFAPAPWDSGNAGKVITKENLKDIRSFGIYVNKAEGSTAESGTLYFDEITAINDGTGGVPNGGSGPGSTPALPGILYGFETGTQGWAVDVNNAEAAAVSVSADAAAEGSQALSTTFSLEGSDFELVKPESLDLSGVDTLSAKVKLSSGTAQARLYLKSGSDWSWHDSGLVEVDANGFKTLTLPLEGIAPANRSSVKAIGLKLEGFTGTGTAAVYLDDVRIAKNASLPQETLYGFEDGTPQGFAINTDNSNQYNTAHAAGLAVTEEVYAAGSRSLRADFELNGGQFQLRRMGAADLSGATKVSARIRIVPADGATPGSGLTVQLFTQSGAGWGTWTAANADLRAVDEQDFVTVELDISAVADRNVTQAIGLQVVTPSDAAGSAVFYLDEVTIR